MPPYPLSSIKACDTYMGLCGGDEIHATDANIIVEDEENRDTKLKDGMEFKSIDEAFESYKEYAFRY
ncbi:hypothetical protein QJS10_CPB13g01154 [Acorus calamus]|uniref:Uncharacterized protein n=1 Tax=Acorus calamus TaxID=4465 RepID=A0AAV9DJ31_ACOCL|nr:hypothetical protein QJS10_CPB13g01154 [Acorus calamus]